MPYARPSGISSYQDSVTPIPPHIGGQAASIPRPVDSSNITPSPRVTSPSPSPHIRPSPRAYTTPSPSSRYQIRRIPAPAILPPIVDSTNSSLHLNLRSEAGSTLSTQVDELLSRHLAGSVVVSPAPSTTARANPTHVKASVPRQDKTARSPPALPPKAMQESPVRRPTSPAGPRNMHMQSRMQMPAPVQASSDRPGGKGGGGANGTRRPLPIPPPASNYAIEHYHQYPASYGPSISKIRSFPVEMQSHTKASPAPAPGPGPSLSPYYGLPPGAANFPSPAGEANQYGLGYGHPTKWTAAQPQHKYTSTPYMGLPSPPPLIPTAPAAPKQSTISRTFAKGGASVLLHKGFFDLLSISPFTSQAGPPTNDNDTYVKANDQSGWIGSQGWLGDKPAVPPLDTLRAVTSPAAMQEQKYRSSTNATGAMSPSLGQKGYRRISVDMISRPTGFTHLAHASDAEEAAELLTRWRIDGKGKLAEPAWVAAIKAAAQDRARARAVAQVQANLDEEQAKGSLKVVNANPESLISMFTDRAVNGSHDEPTEGKSAGQFTAKEDLASRPLPLPGLPPVSPSLLSLQNPMDDVIIVHDNIPRRPILPPPTLRMNTNNTVVIRSGEALKALESQAEDESTASTSSNSPTSPKDLSSYPVRQPLPIRPSQAGSSAPFKPSLETVEKSVATKVYLENHYYGILKRPRDRDQRRAALERELASANMTDAHRRKLRAAWILSETEHLRSLRNKVTVNAFTKIKTIGHGAFGVVSLVREQGSGELYAMKKLRKADMLRKGQEGHVRAERDVMSAASSSSMSRWIVRLVYSFQDVDHLYLVMEYMGGGDLLNLLIEKDTFEESFARFYIAEMVLAIQEAHKLGYIHRDIKPDNFIFSSDGHIKLSDFGLATDLHWAHDGAYYEAQRRQLLKKHGIDLDDGTGLTGGKRFNSTIGAIDLGDVPVMEAEDDINSNGGVLTIRDKQRKKLAYSVVGTNSYMSPEVIRGTGYDQSCDWWSLGVILFECLYGFPPFVSKSRHVTRQKILNWRTALRFPSGPKVSREAQDLITRLICERDDRLGGRSVPSTIRPNAVVVQQRRSGFLGPAPAFPSLGDGAEDIKAHHWFRGLDFRTLHAQEPPFKPDLRDPTDTRYFDEDINDEPLPAPDAQPGQAEATKDPMLRDKIHGKHLLEVRKQLAFQGYTFKSPRQRVYDPRNGLQDLANRIEEVEDARGRSTLREASSGFRRAMSL